MGGSRLVGSGRVTIVDFLVASRLSSLFLRAEDIGIKEEVFSKFRIKPTLPPPVRIYLVVRNAFFLISFS